MNRSKLFGVGGILALVFSLLGTASVVIWHSRLILFIFVVLAVLSFLVAVFAVLLGLHWRDEERAQKSQLQYVAPYKQEPKSEILRIERIEKEKGK
jgi:phosphate/sulfate permease